MKNILFLLSLTFLFACGSMPLDKDEYNLGQVKQELGPSIYFQIYGADDAYGTLSQARASAVARFRAATCLNIKSALVPIATAHKIRWAPASEMSEPGRIAQTTGTWSQVNIRLSVVLQQPNFPNAAQAARSLAHEFYHTLSRRNSHCTSGLGATGANHWSQVDAPIDECVLDRICAAQDCECYNPE